MNMKLYVSCVLSKSLRSSSSEKLTVGLVWWFPTFCGIERLITAFMGTWTCYGNWTWNRTLRSKYYHCSYAYSCKWVLSSCKPYYVDSKPILQSCFSLGYKLLYVERRWLRTPALMLGESETRQAVAVRQLLWSAIYLCCDHVLDCGRTWTF